MSISFMHGYRFSPLYLRLVELRGGLNYLKKEPSMIRACVSLAKGVTLSFLCPPRSMLWSSLRVLAQQKLQCAHSSPLL